MFARYRDLVGLQGIEPWFLPCRGSALAVVLQTLNCHIPALTARTTVVYSNGAAYVKQAVLNERQAHALDGCVVVVTDHHNAFESVPCIGSASGLMLQNLYAVLMWYQVK